MLQKLNERIQGVIAWIVIALIALTFTLFGVDYYMQAHQTGHAEVEVNGKAITKQDFEINYRRARQQQDPEKLTPIGELALRKRVFDELIKNEVTVQAAKSNGFDISKGQADLAITQIPQFQQDGRFSAARYQQALSSAMFTPDSFLKEVQQGMLLNQQRFAFIGSAFALPEEVKHFVKLYMQTRDYEYLLIPTSLFLEKNKITAEAIKNYYDEHQKEFIAPEKISIEFVRLSMQDTKNKIMVSEDELKRYYEDNQSSFLTPAQWQVAHILFAIPPNATPQMQAQTEQKAQEAYQTLKKAPQEFAVWVKTKSDDKLSIANQGLLRLTAGQTEFDKTLINLTKPGEITPPVKSTHGYEIFKLISYKPATIKTYSEVKQEIKDLLVIDLGQAKYAKDLEQLNDLSYQAPDSLLPVAEALKLPIEQTELFSRQGGTSDITKNRQIVSTAFSHDVLKLGNNSEPVQLNNDTVIVLRAQQHIPAMQSPLAEVKEAITNKLALKVAKKQTEEIGLAFLSSLREGKQSTLLSQWPQLRWQTIEKAARETERLVDSSINEFAFSVPFANKQYGQLQKNGDYLIVNLKKINDGEFATLDKEQQASLTQQIEASYGEMDYDLYVNDLLAQAKIRKQ